MANAAVEEFLSWLAVEKGRSANTLAAYRRDLAAYVAFLHKRGLGPETATRTDVEAYLAHLQAAAGAASSVARALASIRGLHRFLAWEGRSEADPAAELARPRVPGGIPKALSAHEVERLLAAPAGPGPLVLRDRAVLEVLYGSGIRISELTGMSLGDLELDDGLVRVLGKGAKERIVPLGSFARAAVEEWFGPSGRPLVMPSRWARRGDAEAVWLNARGGRLGRQGAWLIVRRWGGVAGLSGRLTPHVLRHSCASHLLDGGADIRVVQELLGHASIATTQVYTKVSPERLRAAYLEAHPRALQRPGR